jgi:hypothetical protein
MRTGVFNASGIRLTLLRWLLSGVVYSGVWSLFDDLKTGSLVGELPFAVFFLITGLIAIALVYITSAALNSKWMPTVILFPSLFFTLHAAVFAAGYLSNESYEAAGSIIVDAHRFTAVGRQIFLQYIEVAGIVSVAITGVLLLSCNRSN